MNDCSISIKKLAWKNYSCLFFITCENIKKFNFLTFMVANIVTTFEIYHKVYKIFRKTVALFFLEVTGLISN